MFMYDDGTSLQNQNFSMDFYGQKEKMEEVFQGLIYQDIERDLNYQKNIQNSNILDEFFDKDRINKEINHQQLNW